MTFKKTGDDNWQCHSDSGKIYTISEQSSRYNYAYDSDYMQVWACDCPAATYKKSECKHIKEFLSQIRSLEETIDQG